jgi:SAM-dependent methyltransferase
MTERATAFGEVAEDYDRLRPTPPMDAVRWLVPDAARRVLDLGAGTGAMTRQLVAAGHDVVAVEPDPRMRAVLTRRLPQVDAYEGRGDAIPLADGSVDAAVVSSAWHWMDQATTLPELARVLRPGGRLGVIWSHRDLTVDWLRDVVYAAVDTERARERERRDHHRFGLGGNTDFSPPEQREFPFTKPMTVADVAASLGTYSGVITRGPQEAAGIVDHARRLLADRFGGDDVTLEVPMRSVAFRTSRV